MDPRDLPPAMQLMNLATGFRMTSVMAAAVELGIADAIAAGDDRAEAIARRAGAQEPLVARLLRALVGVGILAEPEPGRVRLTPTGELLRSDAPQSMRDVVTMFSLHTRAWAHLGSTVRNGGDAFTAVYGKPIFEWFAEHPTDAQVFDRAMTAMTRDVASATASQYDFSGVRTVVDVGGGEGTLVAALLGAHPQLKAVVADLPGVVERASKRLADSPIASRVELKPTDFFAEVPAGGDVYLLKTVLHDWNDEAAERILVNVRRAIGERRARVLIIERVLPPEGTVDPIGTFADLNMMVMCGGCERTEAEWRALLGRAGLTLGKIVPLPNSVQGTMLLEAIPAA